MQGRLFGLQGRRRIKVFQELQRALKGLVVMSAQLDAAYANFLFQQVPAPWGENGKGYPSLKPLASWFRDLLARVAFMSGWLKGGPPNSFWISAFFFPQGFMTSALQAHARRYQLPIDMLLFRAAVLPYADLAAVPAPPDNGVYIHGIFMEGARFDAAAVGSQSLHPPLASASRPHAAPESRPEVSARAALGCHPWARPELRQADSADAWEGRWPPRHSGSRCRTASRAI